MIASYTPPQLLINQQLAVTTGSSAPRMGGCLIAPAYLLNRYGKEDTPGTSFLTAGQVLSYRYTNSAGAAVALPSGHVVDTAGARLYGEELEASLATFTSGGTPHFVLDDLLTPTVLKITSTRLSGGTLATLLRSRAVQVGDIVKITDDQAVVRTRKVQALRGVTIDASYGTNVDKDDTNVLNSAYNPITETVSTPFVAVTAPSGQTLSVVNNATTTLTSNNTNVADSATVTIGNKTYTFKTTLTPTEGEVLIGVDADASLLNLIRAINHTGTPDTDYKCAAAHTQVSAAAAVTAHAFLITALVGGTDANAYVTTDTSATLSFTSTTLQGGGATAFNGTVRGSKLGNRYGEEFTVTVRTSGVGGDATVDISSLSGLWTATDIPTTDSSGNVSITNADAGGELGGLNLLITPSVAATPLAQGQVFKFRVYHSYTRLDATNFLIDDYGDGYTGSADTTYNIQVTTGSEAGTFVGAVLRIYDSKSLDEVTTVEIESNDQVIQIGNLGLRLTLAISAPFESQNGLHAGDIYYIHAKAPSESTEEFDKMVLDGPAVDTTIFTDIAVGVGVEFRLPFSGYIAADEAADDVAWTIDATTGITVEAGLALYVEERASTYQWVSFVNAVGELHPSYRAVTPVGQTESYVTVGSTDEIAAALGTITPDNTAAFGAFVALTASEGAQISVMRTGTVELAAFSAALRKLESTDAITFLGVLSLDPTVKAAVKAHVLAMSAPTKMNFRRAYTGTDSPGNYPVAVLDAEEATYSATISDYGGENLLVTHNSETLDFTELGLETGDLVILPGSDEEFEIASILSATELLLVSGPTLPVSPAVVIEIWKSSEALSQASYVNAAAHAMGNRRVMNIWQESGSALVDEETPTELSNMFAAAWYTGLRAGLRPQQGGTRRTVSLFTSMPAMHTKYTPDILDNIAANGTCILMQDTEGGEVYVRHQLTTDVSNGSLYYEDSVGVIADYVSLSIKDLFRPLIGKVNVNRQTIDKIEAQIVNLLEQLKLTDIDVDYGPVIADWDDLVVAQDTILKDRVNVTVTIYVALPLNTIAVTLNISPNLVTIAAIATV